MIGQVYRGRRGRMLLAAAAVGLLALPITASADTSTTTTVGFMNGTAAASGVHALYTPKGLLPIGPPVDLGVPDALTTISAGPETYARSSVADPGDVLANPDAILSQAGIPGYTQGTFPAYPYRATANSSVGSAHDESQPAPGLEARASATQAGSSAEATMPASHTQGIATVGSQTAIVSTSTDGHVVRLNARSLLSGFDLLNGLVHVDSVLIDLTARSDGRKATTTGSTTVTGASVLGQPVTIDAQGIHAEPGPSTSPNPTSAVLGPINRVVQSELPDSIDALNTALQKVGVTVTVAGPVKLGSGSAVQRAETGLRIDLDLSADTVPGLDALLASLPYVPPVAGAPGLSDVIKLARLHELSTIEVGRAAVALSASPGFSSALAPGLSPASPATPTQAGNTGILPATGGSMPLPGSSDGVGVGLAPTASGGRVIERSPLGRGIGALGLVAILVALGIGDRLSAAARWLLAGSDSGPCPLEER